MNGVSGAGRRVLPLLMGVLVCGAAPPQVAPAAQREFAGRPLAEALEALRARGLRLIYSSDLVRPEMIVAAEPPASSPRELLDQLIAPFDLESREGPAGIVLIVAREAARQPKEDLDEPVRPGGAGRVPRLREGIVVTASSSGMLPDDPESRQFLGREEIDRGSRIGSDLYRSMRLLQGVAASDQSAAFNLRGGDRDEVLVVLDGLQIPHPFHLENFQGFSSIIDSEAIGSVEVLRGGFPVEYGDRMSGVLDLSTLTPVGSGRTAIGASFVNSGFLSDGAFGGGTGQWLVSARSWYPDALLDLVHRGGEDINPAYHDALGKVQVQLEGGSVVSGHFLTADDEVDYAPEGAGGRVRARNGARYAWLNLKSPWSPRLYSQTVISQARVQRGRHGSIVDPSEGSTRVDDERSFVSYGLRQDWFFAASAHSLLKWGFEATRAGARYDYASASTWVSPPLSGGSTGAPERALFLRPSGRRYAAFAGERIHVLSPLTIELGARWEKQTYSGESHVDPRLNMIWALGARSALRASWGRLHQLQGPDELQVEDGAGGFSREQVAEHRVIGVEHAFGGGLRLQIEAYRKEMSNLRPRYENLFNPVEIFPESGQDRVRISPEGARAEGVELSLATDGARPFGWWAAYTLASVEDRIDGRMVPRGWDQRHTLNLGVSFRKADRWSISVTGLYHSGWPTTAVHAESTPNPDGSLTILPVLGPRNAERYPSFHRLDLQVSRHIRLTRGSLKVVLEVINLYGRDNVCCVEDLRFSPQPDGSVRVERKEGFWLQQVPSLGLVWEFGR